MHSFYHHIYISSPDIHQHITTSIKSHHHNNITTLTSPPSHQRHHHHTDITTITSTSSYNHTDILTQPHRHHHHHTDILTQPHRHPSKHESCMGVLVDGKVSWSCPIATSFQQMHLFVVLSFPPHLAPMVRILHCFPE